MSWQRRLVEILAACRGDGGVWSVFQDAGTDAQPDLRGVCYIPDAAAHD